MNTVSWFEIYVDDLDKCTAFYEQVFGVELTPNEMNLGGLEMRMFPGDEQAYGATGAICRMEGVKAGGNSTMVYFACQDCAVEESRIAGAGGQVIQSKFQIGRHGFITVAQDPDGNTIGLHSMQ